MMIDTLRLPAISPAAARQIDQTCDRFEAAWKAGKRPDLAEHLGSTTGPERSALLRQLLLLDWEYRRRAGDDVRTGDYQTRFPGDTALIEDVGREIDAPLDSTNVGPGVSRPADTPWSDARLADRSPEAASAPDSVDYDLMEAIGHGGIGVVYRGRDRRLGRTLAIKVLREEYRDRPDARDRFIEEARVGSQLQHPAIVPVYEQGWFDDLRPYITMKLVEGHTLAAIMRDRRDASLDLPRFLGIFEQVCQAVAYAHQQRVIHRDLKPANVMVGAFGEVQVMDWGFAKVLGSDPAGAAVPDPVSIRPTHVQYFDERFAASQSGTLVGTPAYMPPEQARGEASLLDARVDVFALGAILCEILTGRPPYFATTADEVCRLAAAGDLGDAHAQLDACGADEALRELAKRCLDADRSARLADAGVVARDLSAYLASAQERLRQAQLDRATAEARAQEAGAKEKAERRARWLTLALAVAAVLVLTLAGGGWWWREHVRQAQASQLAATDGKVEAALAEAADDMNRGDWSQARAAAIRARELLQTGASEHWAGRVEVVLTDLDMVRRLEEAALVRTRYDRTTRHFPLEKALPLSAEAFAWYGIHPGMDPVEVAARVGRHPASVRDALVSGLENWWLITWDLDADTHKWLSAVLLVADADEWRIQVRRAVVRRDRQQLKELAERPEAVHQPRATVTSLSWGLVARGAYDEAATLLRPAQQRYPDDFWINYLLGLAISIQQPKSAEPLRFYSAALALRPEGSWPFFVNLGGLLNSLEDWDGAISASRKALELQPDSAEAYNHLGAGLLEKGDWEQARAAFLKAIELDPELAPAHISLGVWFERRGVANQAAAAYERAIRLAPKSADAYYGLGYTHELRGDFDAALAAYDKVIELDPGHVGAHNARGNILKKKSRLDDAIAAYERAIRIAPTRDTAHINLGMAWLEKGRSDRAIAACSRAVELNPSSGVNHYSLGIALHSATDWSGAVAAYREAIRLNPTHAEAYCNLRQVLQEKGRFSEALAAIEQGHRLGSSNPKWRYPSAEWLKETQRLVELDSKLPGILDGKERLATAAEHLEYAEVCRIKGLDATSARLHAEAFAADPSLATKSDHRLQAACAAALAGAGLGREGRAQDARERARWREQALDWLRADLTLLAEGVSNSPDGRSRARSALQRWQREKELAAIREPEHLAALPAIERTAFLRFWADVQELLVRCLADG